MRFLREHRSVLILGALLLAGAVAGQLFGDRTRTEGPPLSSHSSSGTGALALVLWLERLGYSVERLETGAQPELKDGSVLFVLQPIRRFNRAEAEAVLSWVRRGGALVYVPGFGSIVTQATPGSPPDALNEELGIGMRFAPLVEETSAPLPWFTQPAAGKLAVHTRQALELRGDEWTPIVAEGDQLVAATRRLEQGTVYVSASPALLANEGVGEADNYAFLLNLLARHPSVQTIAVEEAHHAPAEAPGLMDEMRARPWGWAVISSVLLTMLFLFWGGRRFGPALVVPREPARSSGEYVTAFAGLLQRSRPTEWMQHRLALTLRGRLARLLGVRADAPPADIARRFGEHFAVEPDPLARSLAALDGGTLSERRVLTEVRAIEELLTRARVRGSAADNATGG